MKFLMWLSLEAVALAEEMAAAVAQVDLEREELQMIHIQFHH
jgi:hypothetical protein